MDPHLTDRIRNEDMEDSVEFDTPTIRGYDWEKRSTEIKKRDNNVCQRCGDHNGNYEYYPLVMETHHLVPGKYLPKADARVDLNLVTVCGTCHSHLESSHIERQFAETNRDVALRVLRSLKEEARSFRLLSRELDVPDDRLRTIVSQLERMNCVTSQGNARYQVTCPATAKSAAERARYCWKCEQVRREQLETTLNELRQEFRRGLDDLEYALEFGDQERLRSAIERLREALTE